MFRVWGTGLGYGFGVQGVVVWGSGFGGLGFRVWWFGAGWFGGVPGFPANWWWWLGGLVVSGGLEPAGLELGGLVVSLDWFSIYPLSKGFKSPNHQSTN